MSHLGSWSPYFIRFEWRLLIAGGSLAACLLLVAMCRSLDACVQLSTVPKPAIFGSYPCWSPYLPMKIIAFAFGIYSSTLHFSGFMLVFLNTQALFSCS